MKAAIKIALAILTLSLLALLLVGASPVTRDYSPLNTRWNGLSSLVHRLEADGFYPVIINSSAQLLSAGGGMGRALIEISPETNMSEAWISHLETFVTEGGLLILLDDFGGANLLLTALGAPVRIARAPLVDPVLFRKQPIFPLALCAAPGSPYENMTVVLNIPSYINITRGASGWIVKPLLRTSEYSFADLDGDGEHDPEEPSGPFLVAVELRRAGWRGSIVVIADPSILINCMIDEGDNYAFLRRLLESAGIRVVLLDDSIHHRSLLEKAQAWMHLLGLRLRALASHPTFRFVLSLLTFIFMVAATYTALEGRARGGP